MAEAAYEHIIEDFEEDDTVLSVNLLDVRDEKQVGVKERMRVPVFFCAHPHHQTSHLFVQLRYHFHFEVQAAIFLQHLKFLTLMIMMKTMT